MTPAGRPACDGRRVTNGSRLADPKEARIKAKLLYEQFEREMACVVRLEWQLEEVQRPLWWR